jgi:DNA uptake protein ComE-like DNA-binding protein
LAFKSLPAIVEVFSKRICKYRNIIGGFNSISQLMEVYGIDSIRFESIRPFLEINTS